MLPASVLAIGSLMAGRSPRSHLHPRDAAPRAAPPRCCTAPSAEPPEEEPRKVQGGDQPRKLLTTLQTTRQRAAPSAGTGAVQLARFAPSPRGRDGGGTPLPRSSTKRQKIIALFRGAQEAIGRDDLPKARVLLRHCLEIDQVTSCPSRLAMALGRTSRTPIAARGPSRPTHPLALAGVGAGAPTLTLALPQTPRRTRTPGWRWRGWRRERAWLLLGLGLLTLTLTLNPNPNPTPNPDPNP